MVSSGFAGGIQHERRLRARTDDIGWGVALGICDMMIEGGDDQKDRHDSGDKERTRHRSL